MLGLNRGYIPQSLSTHSSMYYSFLHTFSHHVVSSTCVFLHVFVHLQGNVVLQQWDPAVHGALHGLWSLRCEEKSTLPGGGTSGHTGQASHSAFCLPTLSLCWIPSIESLIKNGAIDQVSYILYVWPQNLNVKNNYNNTPSFWFISFYSWKIILVYIKVRENIMHLFNLKSRLSVWKSWNPPA